MRLIFQKVEFLEAFEVVLLLAYQNPAFNSLFDFISDKDHGLIDLLSEVEESGELLLCLLDIRFFSHL